MFYQKITVKMFYQILRINHCFLLLQSHHCRSSLLRSLSISMIALLCYSKLSNLVSWKLLLLTISFILFLYFCFSIWIFGWWLTVALVLVVLEVVLWERWWFNELDYGVGFAEFLRIYLFIYRFGTFSLIYLYFEWIWVWVWFIVVFLIKGIWV